VISSAITLKQTNPILRGLAVGAMVLVIIRSKLFNVQDSGLGGEAIYTLPRSLALQAVNDTRTRQRTTFLYEYCRGICDSDLFHPARKHHRRGNACPVARAAMRVRSPELQQRATDESRR
jgi:hypothetical protein